MMKTLMQNNLMIISMMPMMCMIINMIPSNNKNIHPILMSLNLMILSIITSMNSSIYMNNHWFSYLMFLILVGGMMILFLYFTSFVSNMKMSMKWMYIKSIPMKSSLLLLMTMLLIMKMKFNMNWYNNFMEIKSISKNMSMLITENNMYSYMYLYNKNILTMISMIYLLLSLTLIVKMCMNKKLSMRKIN